MLAEHHWVVTLSTLTFAICLVRCVAECNAVPNARNKKLLAWGKKVSWGGVKWLLLANCFQNYGRLRTLLQPSEQRRAAGKHPQNDQHEANCSQQHSDRLPVTLSANAMTDIRSNWIGQSKRRHVCECLLQRGSFKKREGERLKKEIEKNAFCCSISSSIGSFVSKLAFTCTV